MGSVDAWPLASATPSNGSSPPARRRCLAVDAGGLGLLLGHLGAAHGVCSGAPRGRGGRRRPGELRGGKRKRRRTPRLRPGRGARRVPSRVPSVTTRPRGGAHPGVR